MMRNLLIAGFMYPLLIMVGGSAMANSGLDPEEKFAVVFMAIVLQIATCAGILLFWPKGQNTTEKS